MKSEEELRSLLEFLEEVASDRKSVRYACEVCVDCREVEWLSEQHFDHVTVAQSFDLSDVDEWIKCLRWVLEIKQDRDRRAKHLFQP